jgi:ABC-type iron transport system FetAB ATPase subunit
VVDILSIRNIAFLENGPYSLELSAGECCGLSGVSGVGKSQLLRAIADVIVHEGECLLGGIPCLSFSPQDWRKAVAMVPAESFWWHDRVGPHFGPERSESAPLMHLITQLGFSVDILNWQVSRLSTGEKQRLSLVRTLVMRPQVLLLDEPTSGLDKKMAAVVEKIVTEKCAAGQCSCLWVSHDSEQLARVAHRSFNVELNGLVELSL